MQPLQSTILNSVSAGAKSAIEDSDTAKGDNSFEDVLSAVKQEPETDGSDNLHEKPEDGSLQVADDAQHIDVKTDKFLADMPETASGSDKVEDGRIPVEITATEAPKNVVTLPGSEKSDEQAATFGQIDTKSTPPPSSNEDRAVGDRPDINSVIKRDLAGVEKQAGGSSVRTPLEQMMVLPSVRQPSEVTAKPALNAAIPIGKNSETETGVQATTPDLASVHRPEYGLAKTGRESATIELSKGNSATEPSPVETTEFDIRITKQNQPEITAPKILSHPVQSILHAQMPENFRSTTSKTVQIVDVQEVGLAPIDLPTEAKSTQTPSLPTVPRPDHQVTVAKQLIEAVKSAQAADKVIEVALNPAELGKVRMMLTPVEAGITINILADRSDTLDLLRRHIADLEQSFMDMGYDDINFSFGQNSSEQPDSGENAENASENVTAQLVQSNIANNASENALAYASNGIDIRV